jgi:hypothetical protein
VVSEAGSIGVYSGTESKFRGSVARRGKDVKWKRLIDFLLEECRIVLLIISNCA